MNSRLAGTTNGRHNERQACWHNERQAEAAIKRSVKGMSLRTSAVGAIGMLLFTL